MTVATPMPSPAVVAGIDGSPAAVTATLWAVDEAVSRDIPLRLIYAITPRTAPSPHQVAHDLATAEIAVREVFAAVESLERPVKVEVEIVQDCAEHALLTASRSATMVCVGALGRDHAIGRRVGSVAALVSQSAHCPVAIVRRHEPARAGAAWVVAEAVHACDGVLESAFAEARLRSAPLLVLTTWQPRGDDRHDARAAAVNTATARAQLERRLTPYRRAYPDLEVVAVAARGTTADFILRQQDPIQLLVVGQGRGDGLDAVERRAAQAALQHTDVSVLICERHSAL